MGVHPILPYQQTADWRIGCAPEFFRPPTPLGSQLGGLQGQPAKLYDHFKFWYVGSTIDGVVNIQISFEANKKVHGRMFNLTFQPSAAIRKTEEAEEKLSQTSNQNVRL